VIVEASEPITRDADKFAALARARAERGEARR
jgi:hypothetical protein